MKIVAIGDSITEGFPYSPQESWVAHLARELQLELVNQGLCGDLTLDMCQRFQRDVIAFAPTHVIILGGANDAAVGYPLVRVSANFTAMVEISRQHGIIPILGLPIPFLLPEEEEFLMEYRNWLNDFASREDITRIDFYGSFLSVMRADQAVKLYVDEVHPSLAGYKVMGETAVRSLAMLTPTDYQ